MPRFRFRLERVLTVRKRQEERERMAFAAAAQRKRDAEAALAEVRRRQKEAVDEAARIMRGRPTIADLVRSHEYRLALLRREEDGIHAVAATTEAFEKARVKLVEARKRRRVLERLRERRHDEWRKAEEDAAQVELDETGLNSWLRAGEWAETAPAAERAV